MQKATHLDFEVRWLPFQLNPAASEKPESRMQAYASKFGPERIKQMIPMMASRFSAVGLPFNFTEDALTSNTFEVHRLLTTAYKHGGAVAQDKASEILFHAYFADGRSPNDPEILSSAAEAAGLDMKAFLQDKTIGLAETKAELDIGRQLRVSGVPHFVIKREGSHSDKQISGAQPPEEFLHTFRSLGL